MGPARKAGRCWAPLGDRFAEAMAEFSHKKVRSLWGFGENENLSNQELIKEKYNRRIARFKKDCKNSETIFIRFIFNGDNINDYLELYKELQNSPILNFFSSFSQGDFFVLGPFTLGILPNINASITMQLISAIFPPLQKLQNLARRMKP